MSEQDIPKKSPEIVLDQVCSVTSAGASHITWRGEVPLGTTMWVMDSELCDRCGELLDECGICPGCGYDGYDYDEDEEDYMDLGDYDEKAYFMGEYNA
jgi:hypothetical protein